MGNYRSIIFLLAGSLCTANFAGDAQERDRVSIIVNATTNDLRGITDLGSNNFRATLDRNPIKVTAASSGTPRHLILMVDASTSMTRLASGWDMAMLAARELVTSVPKECSVGLIIFGAGLIREIGFGEDPQKKFEALNDIARTLPDKKLTHKTALFDALQRGAEMLSPAESGNTIYVITDGTDSNSKTKFNRISAFLLQRQIRLFLFILDNANPSIAGLSMSNLFYVPPANMGDLLIQLSKDTGGTNFILHPVDTKLRDPGSESYRLNSDQMTAFYQALRRVHDLMLHFYQLDVNLTPAKAAEKLTLEILDQNGQPAKNIRLFYASKLYAAELKQRAP